MSMALNFTWVRFEDLSALELHDIIRARESVFVVEQACAYQEVDGADVHAWHLRVQHEDELVAYARVFSPGIKYQQASIGRVMTLPEHRGKGFGHPLMQEAIRFTEAYFPGTGIKIGAQARLQAFYESLGFVRTSEPYDEDGILHIEMLKSTPSESLEP